MRILITGGGTREPIDGVRFITNFSTGATAAQIADYFTHRGDQVTYVQAEGSVQPLLPYRTRTFVTFSDLNQILSSLLHEETFDAVIHLAAVSDYSVKSIEVDGQSLAPSAQGKLPSQKEVLLRLEPNFKIIDRIKSYAGTSQPIIIAFKLTHTPSKPERIERLRPLAENPSIHYVVHNDLGDRLAGRPLFTVYQGLKPLEKFDSPTTLAAGLAQLIQEKK